MPQNILGTARVCSCGSNAGVEVFFQAQPGFFLKKKWGCNPEKIISMFGGFTVLHFIYSINSLRHKPFLTKSIEKKSKSG